MKTQLHLTPLFWRSKSRVGYNESTGEGQGRGQRLTEYGLSHIEDNQIKSIKIKGVVSDY